MMSDKRLAPLKADVFGDRIVHGFFGRPGGASEGIYSGLNCGFGSDDNAPAVAENRSRVARLLDIPADHLLTVYQTHSPNVVIITNPHSFDEAPQADAMVTTEMQTGLGILTADCAPVLFADEGAGVIGAAHAGWKGARGGVLENTVAKMEELGATRSNIRTAIGPTISQAHYEVGADFRDRFMNDDNENAAFFAKGKDAGHFQFDLSAYCTARLTNAGIAKVTDLGACTYADEDGYFSYRRATHRGEPDYGRNISVIVLRP